MFQKKNVLFVLVVGFFVGVFNGTNFAQETEEDEEEIIPVDTTEAYIHANYQSVELVREFGLGKIGLASEIAFSPDGKVVYVADPSNYVVSGFNTEGDVVFRVGGLMREYKPGVGLNEKEKAERKKAYYNEENHDKFSSIAGIGVDLKGNVYVVDYSRNAVKMFTFEGKFVLLLSLQTDLQKNLAGSGASGVAVNSRGDIYMTDRMNGRVQVNDLNGKYKYQITKFKDKTGKELALVGPSKPRINSLDELYVLDPLICRVQRFNVDGDYLGGFGYMGDGAGGFNAPIGLAIDKLDRVYVADAGFGVIQVFSKDGKFLYALCDEHGRNIKIPFVNGIGVDKDNLIYVSIIDARGGYVRVFKYLTK